MSRAIDKLAVSGALATAMEAMDWVDEYLQGAFGTPISVSIKPDGTPVSDADLLVEEHLRDCISSRFPEHGFLGEEHGSANADADFIWVIDPIDGTKNFTRGIPFFSTELALVHRGKVVVGVSSMPILRERLWATRGGGAFWNGEKCVVSTITNLARSHISLGGLNHFIVRDMDAQVRDLCVRAGRVRGFGDSYAYHLVATGRLECVVEAKISFWDVAALSLIIEEAGGECTDAFGNSLEVNCSTVVASNGYIHRDVIHLLRK